MASSGTEAEWPGQGRGQRPCRRRWAWTQEQDARGSTEQDWGGGESPELLEDFRQVQQHTPPLEWDQDAQESGESSREETEADDVSSPEASTLPLPWLPRHSQPLDLSDEELDEGPRSLEVEETGESSPELECEDQGDSSPVVPGQGPAGGWVTSDKQGDDGHDPSGHAEAHPSVELSPARSWSSGTVSLGPPSDSLNSTWEGDTDVLRSTTLAEVLPQSPRHHFPHPDDRNGGDKVALATPTEFQDSLAAPTQNLQCSTVLWGQETTSLPSSLPKDPTWKRTKTSPKPLPSRFTGSVSPQGTRLGPAQKVRSQHKQGATLAGHCSSDPPKYGRGRLNYPLPDFSKVGPRVRFPKDESYRPPKSRGHSRQPQGPTRPLIFKSPAEIVREVLLSSGEASLVRDPPPAHPVTRVPREFQTPEQATELVHQLQEDYHKLLTKYAEAENTIDQLRLGAKVHLYSDPPKPSHSIHSGLVPQGSKVLSFTIPQPQSAERWPGPAQASGATGWPPSRADLSPSSSLSMPTPGRLPERQSIAVDQPSAGRTQTLTSQASQLLAKVESFEGLVLARRLPSQDQIKCLGQLRAAHTALEEEYLQACRAQQPAPQCDTSKGTLGTLDLCRELEAEIYHLGQRLEELQNHMDPTQGEPELCRADWPRNVAPTTSFPHWPGHLPSGPACSAPAIQAYTEPVTTSIGGPCKLPMNEEVSSSRAKAEGSPRDLPAPPRDREPQVGQDFHGLLERYLSVKSHPEGLRMEDEEELENEEELEEEEEEEDHRGSLEVDGPTAALGKAQATRALPRQPLAQAEEAHRAAVRENGQRLMSMKPPSFQTPTTRDRYMPGPGTAEVAQQDTKPTTSHQSSLSSLEGSGPSENLPHKPLLRTGGLHTEESWMASPETDSGFVGSETSRMSPFTQTPEHRLPHVSTPGTSAQHLPTPVPQDGGSQPKARGPVLSRRATEPSTPRSRAQLPLSSLSSPRQQGTHNSCREQTLVAQMVPRSELKRQKRLSEQPVCSRAGSPAPAPTAPPVPHRPAENSPNFLLTRMERNQAIRDLQAEVSLLRLRLEDSLHRRCPGSPRSQASAFSHASRTQDQPADSLPTRGSHSSSKSVERLSAEPEGAESAGPTGRRRARSSSVPREVPRLSLSSESELPTSRLSSENRTSEDLRTVKERAKSGGISRQRDRVSFRGQYTGQEYRVLSPKAVPKDSGTAFCPHCQPTRTQDTGSTITRDPLGASVADALCCPLCGHVRSAAEGEGPSSAPSENTPRRTTRSNPSPKQKSKRAGSPAQLPPGLWYLAAAPPAPAPPALAYISSAPIVPYPPATVYYATPAPTSALTSSPSPARGRGETRHSIQLGLQDLEELQLALSQAAEAAESVRCSTRQLSRSLSADLRHARSLRGSCLF